MSNKNKKALGQFYTTNNEYILQNMKIPDDIIDIIEPFAGNGDLVDFIKNTENLKNIKYNIDCYDIEPKKDYIIKRDTINEPPDYNNKYVITNPPYLARNKSADKKLFDKYNVNDLYKCFIKNIIDITCSGGIIIIPLNFWSSIRQADIEIRKLFLEKYKIIKLNIFEEKVFSDTSYTICSFQFEVKKQSNIPNIVEISVYPSKITIIAELNSINNYMIGGEIYKLPLNNIYKITRLTNKNRDKCNTNILVKCIDDNITSQIGLSYVEEKDIYIDNTPNQSARTYATLQIDPVINEEKQKKLIESFNKYLREHREKYSSLFLTNYRESKDIARKRISFELVYSITEYLLDRLDSLESP
jgi:hypothetical protein